MDIKEIGREIKKSIRRELGVKYSVKTDSNDNTIYVSWLNSYNVNKIKTIVKAYESEDLTIKFNREVSQEFIIMCIDKFKLIYPELNELNIGVQKLLVNNRFYPNWDSKTPESFHKNFGNIDSISIIYQGQNALNEIIGQAELIDGDLKLDENEILKCWDNKQLKELLDSKKITQI